jgi:flagellar biosynthetic protein FliR
MFPLLPFPSVEAFALFGLVLSRMAGLFAAIPLFGGRIVAAKVKVIIIFSMTLVCYPILQIKMPEVPADTLSYGLLVAREAMVGITLSLLVTVVFAAVELCGEIIGLQMGLTIASQFDPVMGKQVPIMAMFQNTVAMLLFLSLSAHHIFIRAVMESYELLPIGGWHMNSQLLTFVIHAASALFVLAIKLAAPVMLSLLVVSVVMGLTARAFPQMNVFIVAMPLNIGIGFLILGLTLVVFLKTLQDSYSGFALQLRALFRVLGG